MDFHFSDVRGGERNRIEKRQRSALFSPFSAEVRQRCRLGFRGAIEVISEDVRGAVERCRILHTRKCIGNPRNAEHKTHKAPGREVEQ